MTSQSDRIQSLVEQINSILSESSPSDSEMASEYQVLEQTRQQLTQLQQAPGTDQSNPQTPPAGSQLVVNDWQAPAPVLAESAQQVLQSIVQEMAYLRMNTVQPLREEITQLQQERSYLATEVQQLQYQRQQLILAQQTDQQQMINGFLHALMGRLQEQLTQQVAQTMVSLNGDTTVPLVSASNEQVVQLDSTLKVLFDSLQASVDTYQDSLEHSLRKMHGLGQQGEAMFTAFVNRLAGQLGREASLHLRPASSPDLDLPSEDSPAALGQGTDEVSELAPSGPADEIAPDYLDQLLEQTPEESVVPPSSLQSSPAAANEADTAATPSNPQTLLTPDAVSIPEPASNPAADNMLDQIIDQLENNEIDAVEAIDNLDLGFGLENLELADAPINPQMDDGEDASVRALEQDVLNQLRQESVNPINLSSGRELDAPLDLAANIRMDEDDSDVDRFMDALSQPQDDQPSMTFEPGLMGLEDPEQDIANHPLLSDRASSDLSILETSNGNESQTEYAQASDSVQSLATAPELSMSQDGGIADVSQSELQMDDTVRDSDDDSAFLLQQLSSELYDDVLGEDFLDEPSASREDSISSPNLNTSNDSSISFLINTPAVSPPPLSDNIENADAVVPLPEPTAETNTSQDLYATFIDDNTTLVDIPTSSTDFDGLGGIERLSDLDEQSGEESHETEGNNTWNEWANHLGDEPNTDVDLAANLQASSLETTSASTPVVDTIHSLNDLIEETGIASRPPVSFPDSAPSSNVPTPNDDETENRSASVDLFSDLDTDSLGGFEELGGDESRRDDVDWGELGNAALGGDYIQDNNLEGTAINTPVPVPPLDEQAQREAELLAGLDLRLDANTMNELASDLSEEEDGLAGFGSDIANSVPLPPPLVSDYSLSPSSNTEPSPLEDSILGDLVSPSADAKPSTLEDSTLEDLALDNPDDNAIEALQGLFSNGEERAEEQWDIPSEPPATNMQEFFADNVLSSSDLLAEPSSPQTQDNGDLFGALDEGARDANDGDGLIDEGLTDDLTPVSWTLDELVSNELSSSPPSTTPTESLNTPSSPESFGLESDLDNEFEDDALVNLMNDLQSDEVPDNGPLSGAEEAKTLADLLRSQSSVSKASAEDTAGFSSPFSGWFGDEAEDADELSDQEKKNNH